MPLPVNKNPNSFQQLAKKVAVDDSNPLVSTSSSLYMLADRLHHGHSTSSTKLSRTSAVSNAGSRLHPNEQQHIQRSQSGSATNMSFGDASSLEDVSSGEGSDAEIHRGEKKKGLFYQKTENVITRMRDLIAQWDVFTSRRESPPFVACLKVSVWFIPVLLITCLWDTLAVCVFEIPHHSWIDYPGFLLGWHFVMMFLAMYGFMLSYLSSGSSPRTKLAGISLGMHYLLLLYRIFMEIYFNGFRGQGKLYIEKTLKLW